MKTTKWSSSHLFLLRGTSPRGLIEMVRSEHPHKQGPALRCWDAGGWAILTHQVLSVSQTGSPGGPRRKPKRAPCGDVEKHLSGGHIILIVAYGAHWLIIETVALLVKIKLNQIHPGYEGTGIANMERKTPIKPVFKARVLLRPNSHVLKFILLKGAIQWGFFFSIFTELCSHHHYLSLGPFSSPHKQSFFILPSTQPYVFLCSGCCI